MKLVLLGILAACSVMVSGCTTYDYHHNGWHHDGWHGWHRDHWGWHHYD